MSEIGACCWIRGLHSGDVGGSVVLHSDGAGALHAAYPHLDDVDDDDADLAVEAAAESARHRPSLSSVGTINPNMDLFCLLFISC